MSWPALLTVATLFLIVFGAVCYLVFHLKSTPVRIAAVILAMGSLVAAMAPIVRILGEPPQPVPTVAIAVARSVAPTVPASLSAPVRFAKGA
jgi:hypothetical protein